MKKNFLLGVVTAAAVTFTSLGAPLTTVFAEGTSTDAAEKAAVEAAIEEETSETEEDIPELKEAEEGEVNVTEAFLEAKNDEKVEKIDLNKEEKLAIAKDQEWITPLSDEEDEEAVQTDLEGQLKTIEDNETFTAFKVAAKDEDPDDGISTYTIYIAHNTDNEAELDVKVYAESIVEDKDAGTAAYTLTRPEEGKDEPFIIEFSGKLAEEPAKTEEEPSKEEEPAKTEEEQPEAKEEVKASSEAETQDVTAEEEPAEEKPEEQEVTAEETPLQEEAPAEEASTQSEETVEMYRMYSPLNGEHFYTGKAKERDWLIDNGWYWEGVAWYSPAESANPVYRLCYPLTADHHYTMKKKERNYLISVGWRYEGVGWYSDEKETVPVYREYNPKVFVGSHNYTTNEKEDIYLGQNGWNREGIGFYVSKAGYSFERPKKKIDPAVEALSSNTNYLIRVDRNKCWVRVYDRYQNHWDLIKEFPCVVGTAAPGLTTPTGIFHIQDRTPFFYTHEGKDICYWATRIIDGYMFHTIIYRSPGPRPDPNKPGAVSDGRMGVWGSGGCIRLPYEYAKWIYTHIPEGTTVQIY
ncbi:MAG: L,D-transpeptidase family protein [Eubacterium sp.]|nr:L,D-transpeptidase family protein [Eubacterium sp.]